MSITDEVRGQIYLRIHEIRLECKCGDANAVDYEIGNAVMGVLEAEDQRRTRLILDVTGRVLEGVDQRLAEVRTVAKAVRDLHPRLVLDEVDVCAYCHGRSSRAEPWPCDTIKALGNL